MSVAEDLRERDAATRRRAVEEFERPLLLEAGAGTGKTSVLVSRVIAWCLGPGWERSRVHLAAAGGCEDPQPQDVAARTLSRVVAITFTEAAAAEMAKRVGEELAAVASGERQRDLKLEILPGKPEERARRAEACLYALDAFRVSTIHAFCRRLLVRHAATARLHPRFRVDADGSGRRRLIREVLGGRLDAVYRGDPDADRALVGLITDGVGPVALEEALECLASEAAPVELLERDPFEAGRVAELARDLAVAAREVEEGLRSAVGARGRLDKALELYAAVGELASAPDRLCGLDRDARVQELEALREAAVVPLLGRLEAYARGEFTRSEQEAFGEGGILRLVRAAGRLRFHVKAFERFQPRRLDLARRALAPALAELRGRLREEGVVGFEELLRAADALLEAHPEVAAAERRRLDQLLVDEFQDTDPVQCRIVERLAFGGPPEERPGLFLVGDPKQSIYSFRGADLRAYDAMKRRIREEGGEVVPLVLNYRSEASILEEVARCVRPVMQSMSEVQPEFVPLLPDPRRPRADAPGVEYWDVHPPKANGARLSAAETAEVEAAWMADDLERRFEKVKDPPYGEVAVLLRSFNRVEAVLRALRDRGIPYRVARDREFFLRREVVDLVSVVRMILDPRDQVALVGALRGPLAGVPDCAWIPLFRRRFPELVATIRGPGDPALGEAVRILREVAKELAAEGGHLPPDFAGPAGLLLHAVAGLRESLPSLPPRRLVERIRGELLVDLAAAGWEGERVAPLVVDAFLGQLAELLEASEGDAAAVLRELRRWMREPPRSEEARRSKTDKDAVWVGSIHGAKGLEFDTAYLLQTAAGRYGGGLDDNFVEPGLDRREYGLLGAATPGLWRELQRRRDTEDAELVRLLYVALTRSRERLVVCRTRLDSKRRSKLGALLEHRYSLVSGERSSASGSSIPGAGGGEDRIEVDLDGARFLLLRGSPPKVRRRRSLAAGAPGKEEIRRQEAELRKRRAAAARRAGRPRGGRASEEAHGPLVERDREPEAGGMPGWTAGAGHEPGPGVVSAGAGDVAGERPAPDPAAAAARLEAQAVGTAVHRALEELDPGERDPGRAVAALRPVIRTSLARSATGEPRLDLHRAEARAVALLERFVRGPLGERFAAIGPGIVARELPLLLPPEEDEGPLHFVAGVADLVYRDPRTGELVVVDFKTDSVEDGPELEVRARTYRRQGALYTRAVREALGLEAPPRFELWFLAAGRTWDWGPGAGDGSGA